MNVNTSGLRIPMGVSKCTLVYGGQWGSEGKGDVVVAIATEAHNLNPSAKYVGIRVGGPNAGHTILDSNGVELKVQSMPVLSYVINGAMGVLGAAAVILPDLLARELRWLDAVWPNNQVLIDNVASVILPEHMDAEASLKTGIGSTGEGVGACTADKVMRRAQPLVQYLDHIISVANRPNGQVEAGFEFEPEAAWRERVEDALYIRARVSFLDTVMMLNQDLVTSRRDLHYFVEGTQGTLLSLNVGGYYPFCTSRDCTPEALMGQIGLSFLAFDEVQTVCVVRTYPIRVSGNSGPLPGEVSWAEMNELTGGYVKTPEITTVSRKPRRIAKFDWDSIKRTLLVTRPTTIALTFVDYIEPEANKADSFDELPSEVVDYLDDMQTRLGVQIEWIGVGPHKTIPAYLTPPPSTY